MLRFYTSTLIQTHTQTVTHTYTQTTLHHLCVTFAMQRFASLNLIEVSINSATLVEVSLNSASILRLGAIICASLAPWCNYLRISCALVQLFAHLLRLGARIKCIDKTHFFGTLLRQLWKIVLDDAGTGTLCTWSMQILKVCLRHSFMYCVWHCVC